MDDYLLSEDEIFEKFGTSKEGLSSVDAKARLGVYGFNKLREAGRVSSFVIFFEQFKSPLVLILLGAMSLSLLVKEFVDFYVIGIIVVLNAVLGFVQEYRAERAIEALKRMLSLKATVVRDGKAMVVSAEDLVPGDIVVLATGDKVPADARLIEVFNLEVQEASLTGESVPVLKKVVVLKGEAAVADRKNMVFSGTIVVNGRARGVVTATGMNTEFGRIAKLMEEAKVSQTPLQVNLKQIGRFISGAVLVFAVVVLLLGLLKGGDFTVVLLTAVALAVAAIPEGLPAVVTVGLSLGVQRLARKNALVRSLPSVETLGSCSVICSDKTGTLTHNEMTVRKLFVNGLVVEVSGEGYDPVGMFSANVKEFDVLLRIGALNNDAVVRREGDSWQVIGDPTEGALVVVARKAGLDVESLRENCKRVGEIEFSSERKRMTTIHQVGNSRVSYVKGAPEVVLDLCSKVLMNGRERRLSREEKFDILKRNAEFAKGALRVLAFAYKQLVSSKDDPESGLVFVGLQAMMDPPRREVKDAIGRCETAGIKVVMITGDHVDTARAVANELGIGGRIVTGVELDSIADLAAQVESIGVYARVNPVHKVRIVEALQARGHIVAMTGDGVNDAPALKKANLGIAMGIAGTDVAKEAAPMVLADDNFASIVRAVEEGRRIFDNIQKYLAYLLSGNIGEVLVVVCALLIGLPLPLIAIQILWINLVTDGLPALALGVSPVEPNVMKRSPRRSSESVFRGIEPYVFIYPIILTIGTLWLFDLYLPGDVLKAQTIAFTSIVMFELFQALSCHSISRPIIFARPFSNKWLWIAVCVSFGLQATIMSVPVLREVFHLVPLSLTEWGMILGVAIFGFLYLEVHKFVVRSQS